jgi:hypothetical protein
MSGTYTCKEIMRHLWLIPIWWTRVYLDPFLNKFINIKVLGKFEIIHIYTYYIDTYSCKFLRWNTTSYGLHKKMKNGKPYLFEQLISIIIVWFWYFFCVCSSHTIIICLENCMINYQDNKHMQKFIWLFYFKIAIFHFQKKVPPVPCSVVYLFSHTLFFSTVVIRDSTG